MNAELLARATFVLHRETAEELAYVSERFGVSRSELVRDLLTEPVSRMAGILREVPSEPTPADLRQLALSGLDMIDDLAGGSLSELREIAQRDD
jgi:hypothetical protein